MQQKFLGQVGGAVAALKPASQQVSSKFLNMIGMDCPPAASETTQAEPSQVPPSASAAPSHTKTNVTTLKESLKYDRVADIKYSSSKRRKTEMGRGGNERRGLVFNETVEVLPIPMRTEYSNRVRSRIWSNALEIHENATRNTIEFASEGWDWRSVKEDDQMYRCVATNELLHPCWVNDAVPVLPKPPSG